MVTLRSTIESLAAQFAYDVIGTLRGASIDELYALAGATRRDANAGKDGVAVPRPRRAKGGRLWRRSPEELRKMVDAVVALLQKRRDGLRAEQIREALGCEAKELPRPLAVGLAEGRITKDGQKRATTYFAGSGGAGSGRRRGRKKKG